MFNESWPWKRDLAVAADRLEEARFGLAHRLKKLGDSDDFYEEETEEIYRVERDVMSGAFAARRLIGMPSKMTKGARATKAVVTRFPLRDGAKTPDTWDTLGDLEMYKISAAKDETISANDMCNLFIHSFIFRMAWTLENLSFIEYWSLREDDARREVEPMELTGLLVASDNTSSRYLTLVSLAELVRVFQVLANDEVTLLVSRRDRQGRLHLTAT